MRVNRKNITNLLKHHLKEFVSNHLYVQAILNLDKVRPIQTWRTTSSSGSHRTCMSNNSSWMRELRIAQKYSNHPIKSSYTRTILNHYPELNSNPSLLVRSEIALQWWCITDSRIRMVLQWKSIMFNIRMRPSLMIRTCISYSWLDKEITQYGQQDWPWIRLDAKNSKTLRILTAQKIQHMKWARRQLNQTSQGRNRKSSTWKLSIDSRHIVKQTATIVKSDCRIWLWVRQVLRNWKRSFKQIQVGFRSCCWGRIIWETRESNCCASSSETLKAILKLIHLALTQVMKS